MFLIAKIVRGRRLLHELEKQEKDEHLAADAAAQSNAQVCWDLRDSIQFFLMQKKCLKNRLY